MSRRIINVIIVATLQASSGYQILSSGGSSCSLARTMATSLRPSRDTPPPGGVGDWPTSWLGLAE